MFRIAAAAVLSSGYFVKTHDFDFKGMWDFTKRMVFLPDFTPTRSKLSNIEKDSLLCLFNNKTFENVGALGDFPGMKYKRFIEFKEEAEEVAAEIGISPEEVMQRTDMNMAYFYKSEDGKYYASPERIKKQEIRNWVAACRYPIAKPKNLKEYFDLARASLHTIEDYMVVVYGGQEMDITQAAIENWKSPFVQINSEIARRLELEEGAYICRQRTKFDGDMDVNYQGDVKYIKYDPLKGLFEKFLVNNGKPKMHYIDKFEKVFPLFKAVHDGSGKVVYILTSNIHNTSQRYLNMLEHVAKLSEQHPDITFAILPKDQIAGKLGVTRSKKFRRFKDFEARYLNFFDFVGIKPDEEGKFQSYSCREDKNQCSQMMDDYYMQRAEYASETMEELDEWIEKVNSGDFEQYYEKLDAPLQNVKKINRINFEKEVIKSENDVLLEIYGKFCPACNFFAPKFDSFAGEMQEYKNLTIGKVCADHNYIPELKNSKPYTPIFWYYKAGDKDNPVQYEGKNDPEQLRQFIRENASFSLDLDK